MTASLFSYRDQRSEDHRLVFFVLGVFEVFVRQLTDAISGNRQEWSAEQLRVSATDFLDELIKHAHADKAPRGPSPLGPRTLGAFRVRVLQESSGFDFWKNLQQNIRALSDAPTPLEASKATKVGTKKKRRRRRVTQALVKRRRELVNAIKRDHGWNRDGLRRYFQMSPSTIDGIIREDQSRYADDKQQSLLEKLGVSVDQWYGKSGSTSHR